MNLRNKTLAILATLFILTFLLLSAITYIQIQQNYVYFDKKTAEADVERAARVLDGERGTLVITLQDWAMWDDTYRFLEGGDHEYIERNLNSESLSNLRLNFVIFTNSSGTLFYQKWLDHRGVSEIDIPASVSDSINSVPGLLNVQDPTIRYSGILATDDGPVLIAAMSVLNSAGEGPIHGTMVIGRFLDEQEMTEISAITSQPVRLVVPAGNVVSPATTSLQPGVIAVRVSDDRNLTGSLLTPDLSGQRYVLLEVISAREFYSSGGSALLEFFLVFAVVNIAFIILFLFFIDRYILARLGLLTSRVNEISGETEDIPDFSVPGNDELSRLGNSLNLMMHRLRESRRKVRESEEQFRLFIHDFPGTIFVKDQDSRFLMVSQKAETIFHHAPAELLGSSNSEIFPPSLAERFTRWEKDVLALPSGEYREYTEEADVEGRTSTYMILLFPIHRAGDAPLIGGFAMDVTQIRMEKEALLRAHKKMKILSSITRHDITNKISLLLAYGQIMREHTAGDPTMMEIIRKQSSAVNAIRHQIEFAKDYQEMGYQAPRWQKASLVLVYAASHLDFTGVNLKNGLGNLELFADPMLEKVFYNLLENSLRHGIRVTRIQVDFEKTEDSCLIFFEDDGIGIPDERKEEIFGSDFGREKGLGLFLVREILGITKITIREIGIFGTGAKFEIRVPLGKYHISEYS
jgi:PAS domain S-box-containing protein